MHIRLSWSFLKNTNTQVLLFFSRPLDVFLMNSYVWKTTGLYDDLLLLDSLFHFFYFIFSAPISLSLYSPISLCLLLYVWCSFSSLYQVYQKSFLHIYINSMYNICIYLRKLMNFCLTKKFMTFFISLVWLTMNRMLDF